MEKAETTIGKTEEGDLQIYICRDVYDALEAYAASDKSKELGSVLIGKYLTGSGRRYLIISGWIEAKYAQASESTLTFTHGTWEYIHREKDEKYPDKRIVGWQHTHPGYDVFLSSYDLFIQENFFNLEFQTAYVIDPVHNTRGFFQWKNGKIERLGGFHIYEGPAEPALK